VELPAVAAPYRLVREGMREREKVMMNFVTRAPDLLLICTCNAMGAHNQELVGSPPPPPIRVRGKTGVGLGPVPLVACWGHNPTLYCSSLVGNTKSSIAHHLCSQ
jgi:hypothetical protein